MAAIDESSHAFVPLGATQEHESNEEWSNRVMLPKFWGNGRGAPAVQADILTVDHLTIRQQDRDTGQWLPIAESAQSINDACVRGERSGGVTETGDMKKLAITLYEPGSRQDRKIQEDQRHGDVPTVTKDDDDDSAGDDLDELQDHFASLLNIDEYSDQPQPRQSWERHFPYLRVGQSDPNVKNLGSGWIVEYNSVTSLLPANSAASSLSLFYKRVIDKAAESIASNATTTTYLNFQLDDLSLRLTSPNAISWEWVIRFAREMSHSSNSAWTVLYNAVARNVYWN
ncbi:MAG: hypothetical protein Q9219_007358, partial [cf. Caloplaca sp. 3 TL-2023]